MQGPEKYINYHGQDWKNLKLVLTAMREKKIGMLVGESTHDQSNKLRGAIAVLGELLNLEKNAAE